MVGTVIFLILVVINFVVITKGSGRIAEVTARFTLDAMPGKQMSIDAEMNSGVITEAQALEKRERLQKDADFYGSMDGASKFVRGDAIAGIIITVVNVVGGILIGYFQRDMLIVDALETYTILSIGDGLVSQIPSIIVSIAAGILVTRSSEEADLGEFVGKQLTIYPRAIAISGALLLLFALFLSETFWPFFSLSLACFATAFYFSRKAGAAKVEEISHGGDAGSPIPAIGGGSQAQAGSAASQPGIAGQGDEPQLSPMESALNKRFSALKWVMDFWFWLIRKRVVTCLSESRGLAPILPEEMGMLLPTIGVRDNIELEPNEYRFLLRGKEVVRSTIVPDRVLAMSMGGGDATKLKGIPTIEPVFGIQAMWVLEEEKKRRN